MRTHWDPTGLAADQGSDRGHWLGRARRGWPRETAEAQPNQAPADRTCACADVNVFHLLLKDPKIPEADREFTIQIAAVFGPTLGITLSSLTILLFDNTFLLHS